MLVIKAARVRPKDQLRRRTAADGAGQGRGGQKTGDVREQSGAFGRLRTRGAGHRLPSERRPVVDRRDLSLQSLCMSEVAETRTVAAARWWPPDLRLLLVAEAPPTAPDRYFYFEHVRTQDSLFRYVHKGLTGRMPSRDGKADGLAALQELGVGLVDVSREPLVRPGVSLARFVPDLG